jgi:hypothetical protein
MLEPRRYVQPPGPDLVLRHLVRDRLRQYDSPLTSYVGHGQVLAKTCARRTGAGVEIRPLGHIARRRPLNQVRGTRKPFSVNRVRIGPAQELKCGRCSRARSAT